MNVGSLISSLTTSLADGGTAPFASAAMESGSCDVFTVAMVSLLFSSGSPPQRASGPSGGVTGARASTSLSVRSYLARGTSAVRSPRAGDVLDRYVLYQSTVVIPDGKILTVTHPLLWRRLLVERGERPLQEFERAAELGEFLRRGPGELRRKLLSQSPLDEHARGQ